MQEPDFQGKYTLIRLPGIFGGPFTFQKIDRKAGTV